MSPRSMPSRCAVSGWISTHELQRILVTGSGSSCNHGLFAPRPSPSTGDGYVTRKKSPDVAAGGICIAGVGAAALAARGATEPAVIPFANAADAVGALLAPGTFASS